MCSAFFIIPPILAFNNVSETFDKFSEIYFEFLIVSFKSIDVESSRLFTESTVFLTAKIVYSKFFTEIFKLSLVFLFKT